MAECLKCINSACCRLKVEINRAEYNRLTRLGLADKMTTRTGKFLKENPKYKKHYLHFDEIYKDNFAIINRQKNGYCVLLNNEMKCTIYKDRPTTCKEYSFNRCEKIRKIKN